VRAELQNATSVEVEPETRDADIINLDWFRRHVLERTAQGQARRDAVRKTVASLKEARA
jgi:hypothetical protein